MYQMAVFHGHGEGDSGAIYNGKKEIDYAKKITAKVVEILNKNGVQVLTNVASGYNNYHRNLTKGVALKHKMACSIHLNIAGGDGAEVLVPLAEKDLKVEFKILEGFKGLKLPSRGLKSRDYDTEKFSQRKDGVASKGKDYYKEIREAWSNGVSLSIVEVGFLDNSDNMKVIDNNIDNIAKVIANSYLEQMNIKPKVEETERKLFTVQVGAFSIIENAQKMLGDLKSKGFDGYIK